MYVCMYVCVERAFDTRARASLASAGREKSERNAGDLPRHLHCEDVINSGHYVLFGLIAGRHSTAGSIARVLFAVWHDDGSRATIDFASLYVCACVYLSI